MFFQSSQRPLRSLSIFLLLGIFDKLLGFFIDREVSQVNKPFGDIFALDIVLVCCESSQAFLEHVNAKGVIASYHNVDSEIVLEVVD